jgi:hypothetical protein
MTGVISEMHKNSAHFLIGKTALCIAAHSIHHIFVNAICIVFYGRLSFALLVHPKKYVICKTLSSFFSVLKILHTETPKLLVQSIYFVLNDQTTVL